ncbi:WAT1-related protein At1g43650-like isoform X2 [Salvia miltiorrhiza]|uniref:WAT1-related protein At1g43650-like isoform X2 n=1 Tax=Salvia miltiorrhiza TaxID=226208 RepID=UPI0025ABF93B|nr:WAT1-related protein At1g43650-like isoform X2 [Salvia miltiorrhiza]
MGKSFNMVKILEKKKAYIVMILVQLAYAGMSLFSKTSINKGMNPFVFVAYRQAFATLALLPFALFLDRKKGRDSLTYSLLWKIFLVSLFGITLSLNLYIYAINYVSATFASASNNSIPAFTFAIAVGLRIERFSIRDLSGIVKLVGAVVSFSGAMVFAFVKGPQFSILNLCEATRSMRNPSTDFSSEEKWIQGCLLMLLANIIWASWLVMQGVVVTGISYWLFLWAVESKGPLFTASFTPLQLIFTATFSAFLWNEMLHIGSICGGMLLVGGLYCVLWGKKREEEVEKEADKGTMDETHV